MSYPKNICSISAMRSLVITKDECVKSRYCKVTNNKPLYLCCIEHYVLCERKYTRLNEPLY